MSRFDLSAYLATFPANTNLTDTPVGQSLTAIQQDPVLSRNKFYHAKMVWKLKKYVQALNDSQKFDRMNSFASQLLDATAPQPEVAPQPFDQATYLAAFPAGTLFADTPVGQVFSRLDRLEAKVADNVQKTALQARKAKISSNLQNLLSAGSVQQVNSAACRLYVSMQSRTETHLKMLQAVLRKNAGTMTTTAPTPAPTPAP